MTRVSRVFVSQGREDSGKHPEEERMEVKHFTSSPLFLKQDMRPDEMTEIRLDKIRHWMR